DAAIEAQVAEVQESLNIGRGPLIRVHLFRRRMGGHSLLLVVVHHLAIDGVSWRILLEDLHSLCGLIAEGRSVELPPKTTSFQQWASRLQEFSETDFEGLSYWTRMLPAEAAAVPRDFDCAVERNTIASAAEVRCSLDAGLTNGLLHEAPRAFNTRIDDILLTALLLTFRESTGRSTLQIDMEGHGREDLFAAVDLSRTVGWFTTLYPVALHAEHDSSPEETVKAVKEQLREIPLRGLGYGLLRYFRQDAGEASRPRAEILFNYLGQTDRALAAEGAWKPVLGLNGPEQSPANERSHVLEINGIVSGGQLTMTWTYSREIHEHSTIERIARRYNAILSGLVDKCRNAKLSSFTPSDFPAARIDQESLDALIAHISE
ncbi:MAG: condensation domain-containing protein, partial [Bryobacteraceae bacterium]